MKRCPVCGWKIKVEKSIMKGCWVVMCEDFVCYAKGKLRAKRGWRRQYEKWSNPVAGTAIEVWAGAYCYYPKPKELKPIDWTDRKSKQATPPKAGKDDKD